MSDLVSKGGHLVCLMFPLREADEKGPPYALSVEVYHELLSPNFKQIFIRDVQESEKPKVGINRDDYGAQKISSMATDAQFNETISTAAPTQLVVADFTATWCGPCKAIKPLYAELASKYKHVTFVTVDIDQLKETAAKNSIQSVPTFHFYKGGELVASMKGADPRQLQTLVEQHQGPKNESSAGPSVGPHGNLAQFIDTRQIECLNQSDDHTVGSIFGTDAKQFLESDVDEQIILVIPFNQVVKLHSLIISGPKDKAPKSIKTYINRATTLSFEEGDSIEPIEVLDLSAVYTAEGDLVSATVPLRFVKYQSVSSITLFVGQNLGGEETTVINKLALFGSPVEVTKNLAELKKDDHQH
ncbi:thiopurine S-methyltransferase [Chytriomyces confervae]|uniref:Thiopurine S-methyltransferase n=1 Tax=Chytriomyces confervae TaxID=246404 RepID=A0A507D083_9FUNG|nr:thiopurine S-methyltransferase [Chytriomyces confervae]